MNLKNRIALYRSCIKRMFVDIKQLSLGQKTNYDLLQLSHRLEKGLLIKNPKPLWGWEKAYRIVELLKVGTDQCSALTAQAVLSAYLKAKSLSEFNEDREKYAFFMRQMAFQPITFEGIGGIMTVKAPCFTKDEHDTICKLFDTRHSCREFSERQVSEEDIKKAVRMALRCPSACNRQPFHVYVIDPIKLAKELGYNRLQYEGNRSLIITGDVRAFTNEELLDWIVSPSIFAGFLTLALHSQGIGSCVVRKDLVNNSRYNDAIRTITGMDESEIIILELFIGYYENEYLAPVSNRIEVNEIVKFI